ncbi:MAG TPA: MFS transporter [Polyangia bacterium]|jgi:MFS family permease|nr:MFS transporter [Polyangia bacterium]
MTTAPGTAAPAALSGAEIRKVIFASSLGTVFEWYDFYIYATLAPFFATLFFPKGNATAALLASFATYAAGFLVRPFGALVFGRVGDLVGRKYTFLVTIMVMGLSTAAVGVLPTYASVGMLSPAILVLLRLAQGLALGGEYGGAATYVAEHAPDNKRGLHTSWIQTTATLGFFVSLVVIGVCRANMTEDAFKSWGWRIPFLISLVLLVVSVYIRLKLDESPVFLQMKALGKGSKAPLRDSFTNWSNLKIVLIALFGAAAGQGVIWYTGQFYALFFLTGTLKLPWKTGYLIVAVALALGTGLFVFFGWLSDRIGRKKIMIAGCVLGALTYFPIYRAMTHFANPALESFAARTKITLTASNCEMHLFPNPKTVYSDCNKVQDFLSKKSLSYETLEGEGVDKPVTHINDAVIVGWDEAKLGAALKAAGAPGAPKPEEINVPMLILLVFIQLVYVTMVYGPIAAFLVELFPARIRYTSMSLPYHIGNGWFGGMLPLTAAALVAAKGDIFAGLWYPVIVAAITAVIGVIFVRESRNHRIDTL